MKYLSLITLTALLGLASCGHFSKGHCCHKREKVCKEHCKKDKKECKEKCHKKSKMKDKKECGDHCKKPESAEKKAQKSS